MSATKAGPKKPVSGRQAQLQVEGRQRAPKGLDERSQSPFRQSQDHVAVALARAAKGAQTIEDSRIVS
jgi:hypothetical protein